MKLHLRLITLGLCVLFFSTPVAADTPRDSGDSVVHVESELMGLSFKKRSGTCSFYCADGTGEDTQAANAQECWQKCEDFCDYPQFGDDYTSSCEFVYFTYGDSIL